MFRLSVRSVIVCGAALGSLGCSGQNIEGAWLGPLPVAGDAPCRIKIYSDHRFDVACGNLDYAGAGTWDRDGNRLTLRFQAWVHQGKVQRDLPVVRLSFVGQGNTLRLNGQADRSEGILWRRANP